MELNKIKESKEMASNMASLFNKLKDYVTTQLTSIHDVHAKDHELHYTKY